MEKITKSSENNVSLKDVINWIVVLLVPLIPIISTELFNSKDNDIFLKVFFVSLITSFLTTFVWIKFFSGKNENKLIEKLNNRLIKEIETRKDLEKKKEELERSLAWEKTFRSRAEKDKEKLEKENKKLQNERDQLRFVLPWCGISEKEVGIDGNISFFEWEKKPKIQKKREEILKKEELWELEGEVSSLRKQLEDNGISPDKHHVRDKRLRKEVISEVEAHWRLNQDKNGKINGKVITKVLEEGWKNNFNNKESEGIIKERDRLIRLIYEEVKLSKK